MDVKIRADDAGGAVDWTIDGKKPHNSVIKLEKKSGAHTLDFKLDDRTGLGLRFDLDDPIWIHENEHGQCPSQGVATDQIQVETCTDKRLSISNANSGGPRTLQYRLNFVDEGGNRADVDPVIKNGGNL